MRNSTLVALLGAALIVLAVCVAAFSDARASTVLKLDLAGLFDRAEHVVHGRVLQSSVKLGAHSRPETTCTLEVTTSFWGDATSTLTFRTPGGALADGREMVIPGLPKLAVGEEVLLFLTRESKRGLRVPVGLAQGKFQVVRDEHGPELLLRGESDLEFLDPTTGVPQQLSTLASLGFDATASELERLARERRAREAAARK